MWRNPNIVRPESSVEAQPAFIPNHFPGAVKEAVVRELSIRTSRLLLQSRFDEVERQTEERSKEARDSRCAECLR